MSSFSRHTGSVIQTKADEERRKSKLLSEKITSSVFVATRSNAVHAQFYWLAYTVKPVQSDHPLVQTKAVFVDRWPTMIRRFHTLKQCETLNERGDRKEKNHKDHKQRWKREIAKLGFSAGAFLGLPSDFCWGTSQKRRFWIITRSLEAGKIDRRCTKNPVAGGARQVVAIRCAVSVWNCPCTKKPSFEAGGVVAIRGGRWSKVLLYAHAACGKLHATLPTAGQVEVETLPAAVDRDLRLYTASNHMVRDRSHGCTPLHAQALLMQGPRRIWCETFLIDRLMMLHCTRRREKMQHDNGHSGTWPRLVWERRPLWRLAQPSNLTVCTLNDCSHMPRDGFYGGGQSEARKTGLDRVINARLKWVLDKWSCPLFVCLGLRSFSQSPHWKKCQSWLEVNGSAWVRFKPPTFHRKSLSFQLGHGGTWWFRLVEEPFCWVRSGHIEHNKKL